MNINQLKPAHQFAKQYGVKMLGYGPPGEGKTPLINTAPRPVLAFVEPGMLSMRNSNVPTWEADTPEKCDEFFDWVFRSPECAKNFDTICLDSASEMAEMYLRKAKGQYRNKLQAYGDMSEKVYGHLSGLYYLERKHVYLICKQGKREIGPDEVEKAPYFPGQELNVKVPHLYDLIAHISKAKIPGVVGEPLAIRCKGTYGISARERSGICAEFEPPDLSKLFAKIMA